MSDRIRSIALFVVFALTACGGDSTAGGGVCQDGQMSTPGSSADPCAGKQAATECVPSGGKALALCKGGSWGTCMCIPGMPAASATGANMGAATAATACGNGKIDVGEMCDGMEMGGASCASVMPGSTGVLNCKACKLDMQYCTKSAAAPAGGAGAPQGGTGARTTTGTAGSGGTGR
jgi:hypothetical protein